MKFQLETYGVTKILTLGRSIVFFYYYCYTRPFLRSRAFLPKRRNFFKERKSK
jgi:hypothetical protein